MNYQTSALLFYSGKVFLGTLVCLFLAFFGVSAPVFYLLITGLVLPVAISLRLHSLKERGAVLLPQNLSEWIIYVQGIPVRETRNTLANPGFFSIDRARMFFANAFGAKLCVQLAAIVMLLQQAVKVPTWMYLPAALAAGWLLYSLWQCAHALLSILTRHWLIQPHETESGSAWYFGYLEWRGKARPALDGVLGL